MNTLQITQPLVSVQWLAEHLDHPDLVILDATIKKVTTTNDSSVSNLKIIGSRFFDIKKTFSDLNTDLPNMLPSPASFSEACKQLGIDTHHTVVVYDKLGIYSSPRVWWMFKIMGHKNVAVLDGGLPIWQKEKLPCQPENKEEELYPRGNFEANFNPKLVSDAKNVLAAITLKDTLILDARSSGRFNATEPEPRTDLKGGHIPNSKNLPYKTLIENTQMKSTKELSKILKDFSIENKKLIFTCGSGITACILMLAADLSGYQNMSVYDGSWSEWGQLDHVPIEK